MHAHISAEVALLPQRRLWTYKEFERAAKLGLFAPEERLELIEGEVIRKVAPQLTPHATSTSLVEQALRTLCPRGHYIRIQLPLKLGTKSGPEPDIAVVVGGAREYAKQHPTTAALIVEVADSSLRLDRGTKAALYARANVPEYWILDLKNRVLEVCREPKRMEDQPLGHHYGSIMRYTEHDAVSPLLAPASPISVADLLP
jgi:Uma2 family endonuclease